MMNMDKKIKKVVSEIETNAALLLSSPSATHGISRSLRDLRKELTVFKAQISASRGHIETKNKHRVQIGGGRHYLKGFLNIDIIPPADIIWDIRESIPLRSNSVSFIFSEHFLEHIDYPVSAKKFVRECRRVLKKNGRIVIGVPDSGLVVKAYCRRDRKIFNHFMHRWYRKRNCHKHFNTPIDLLNYHFRDQDDDRKYNPHLWAYDSEKLCSMLKNAGFLNVKKWRFDKAIANLKRKWGSIYVTAKK